MKSVGDHLAGIASSADTPERFDRFGRSAFNRYYYSAFLAVREVLKTIDKRWATPSHQEVPAVLNGEVLKRIKKQINTETSAQRINYGDGVRMLDSAKIAISELSNLLAYARGIRRVADYEPEELIQKQGRVVRLRDCTLESAKEWEGRVNAFSKTILRIYDDLGLI